MTAATDQVRHAAPARGHRSKPVIAGLTVMIALWLGLTAPAVSPVAAAARPQQAAPAVLDQTVDQDLAPPVGSNRGLGGRGRR
jgi:hypothetical protein